MPEDGEQSIYAAPREQDCPPGACLVSHRHSDSQIDQTRQWELTQPYLATGAPKRACDKCDETFGRDLSCRRL